MTAPKPSTAGKPGRRPATWVRPYLTPGEVAALVKFVKELPAGSRPTGEAGSAADELERWA